MLESISDDMRGRIYKAIHAMYTLVYDGPQHHSVAMRAYTHIYLIQFNFACTCCKLDI